MHGYVFKSHYRRPRYLKNLRIEEVSSVDRGAGEGTEIVFTKYYRDLQREPDMQPQTLLQRVDVFINKISKAQINKFEALDEIRRMAADTYPGDPKGFAKFINDNTEGIRANNHMARLEYVAQQFESANGDGYRVAKQIAKSTENDRDPPVDGGPDGRGDDGKNPWHSAVRLARSTLGDHHPTTRHLLSLHGKWATEEKGFMKRAARADDERWTREHRAEKLAKGLP